MHFLAFISNYNGVTAYICRLFIPTTAFLVLIWCARITYRPSLMCERRHVDYTPTKQSWQLFLWWPTSDNLSPIQTTPRRHHESFMFENIRRVNVVSTWCGLNWGKVVTCEPPYVLTPCTYLFYTLSCSKSTPLSTPHFTTSSQAFLRCSWSDLGLQPSYTV